MTRAKRIRDRLKIGDRVRVLKTVHDTYYDRTDLHPLTPDIIGVVGAIRVPCVTNINHRPYGEFVCVDWQEKNGTRYRSAVSYDNLVIITGS